MNSKVLVAAVIMVSLLGLVGAASAITVVGGSGEYPLLIKTGPGAFPDDFTQVGWIYVDTDAGTVRVITDDLEFPVGPYFPVEEGIGIRALHVQASPEMAGEEGSLFPLTNSGNPKVGKFEVSEEFDECVTDTGEWEFTVPEYDEYYYMAVHVELCNGETAWGGRCPWEGWFSSEYPQVRSVAPIQFPGNNWFFYFTVPKMYEEINGGSIL